MHIPHLLEAVKKPETDAISLHPALLNAIYLAACYVNGPPLERFTSFFLERTRHHMHQSLANADRLTHFMWASVILGSYYIRNFRLHEAYTIISSCARFAAACGLDVTGSRADCPDSDYASLDIYDSAGAVIPSPCLLPPAADEADELERVRLSHSIYMVERCIALMGDFPSVFTTSALVFPYADDDGAVKRRTRDGPPSCSVSNMFLIYLRKVLRDFYGILCSGFAF